MVTLSRRNFLASGVIGGAAIAACSATTELSHTRRAALSMIIDVHRQPDEVIRIWVNGPPSATTETLRQHYVERANKFGLPDRAIHEVTDPTLSVFRARKPNGDAILIVPGGGYNHVVIEKEGFESARYFNKFGYDVYVMNYRLPHQGWVSGADTPLQDAQRASRIVRKRNGAGKLIVLGFSAGGHLAGSLAQRFDSAIYPAGDSIDGLSCRPDLVALVYPVTLMGSPLTHQGSQERLLGKTAATADLIKYDLTKAPNPKGPKTFLVHALDDEAVPYENSLQLALAYRATGVPSVLHSFETGGHGFGLRGIETRPVAAWPRLLMAWIEAQPNNSGPDTL